MTLNKMKVPGINTVSKLLAALFLLLLPSCSLIYDQPVVDEEIQTGNDKNVSMLLKIQTIDNSETGGNGSQDFSSVEEYIESLRIIIINDEDRIEENLLLMDLKKPVKDYEYLYQKYTDPGFKRFYILANEKSVGQLYFEDLDQGIEKEIEGKTLTGILERYQPENSDSDDIKTLEMILASVYFKPDYKVVDNTVAIPYISYYGINMEAGTYYKKPMYLVPVATKFDIRFYNNRNDEVTLKSVTLSSVSENNFLLARVGEDYEKDGLYWIDWLGMVSDASQRYPEISENEDFNNGAGWILDYSLPFGTESIPRNLLSLPTLTVRGKYAPEAGQTQVPGEEKLHTVYLPECKNIPESNLKSGNSQSYTLSLEVVDKNTEEITLLSRTLSNVKALFRNSHVVIDVVFSEGYMHVYGMVMDWGSNPVVNGFVIEEEEL